MSTFPSILSVISDPAATNKLNSPSHSSIETAQNDAVEKLETFIGTQASAVGTLMYDIRATASDGGGHVQAANKGGTGQTTYAKGDVLIAQSSSVLTKLAIGTNNQVLTADSDQATGVKWGAVATVAEIQNQTYIYARASVMSGSVFGVKLSTNPSILSDGLGLVIKFPAVPTSSLMALQVFTSSSGSVAALIKKTNLDNLETTDITASMIGVLEFDSVSSVFQMVTVKPSSEIILVKTVDETVNNSSTLQDDDTFTFSGVASTNYRVKLGLLISGNNTALFKTAWSLPAGAVFIGGASNFNNSDVVNLTTGSGNYGSTNNSDRLIFMTGIIKVAGTAGTCVLQWAQQVANASDTKVLIGSWFSRATL